jgi:hypothetical protein
MRSENHLFQRPAKPSSLRVGKGIKGEENENSLFPCQDFPFPYPDFPPFHPDQNES